ncbi:BTAD domain-containing putative transcriptional regulator [Taklimakanibacter deserti]|uniref:BTAD domain-containing putative transcriptional regulator n=1 Tax=Taklimakanibacter deserti TaxID=2267839 RepID=UPI000E650DA5
MAMWSLRLLGGFAVERAGEQVELHNRKDRLLLGFLGLQSGRPVSRDRLAGLLWADRAEEQARGSLRQSLAALRGAFGNDADSVLLAGRDSVSVKPSAFNLDVEEFERRAADISTLAASPMLYSGPLLDGFEAPSPEYGQWLLPERQRLEDLAASVVERLATTEMSQQDLASAVRLARRLLDRDRLREPVCRALMQLLVRDGKRTEALKLFAQCEAALTEELGVKAAPETEKVYRDILGAAKPAEPIALAMPAEGRPSIAVMPFHNISREPDLDVLCEGLAEDITSGLGRFRLFSVIDRFSSAEIAKTTSDAQEIGKRLGVDLVVQGSLQRPQDCLRMTVKLVDTATRTQKWSGQFNLKAADILSAPDKIMAAVLPSINAQVESTLLERSRRKPTLAAYEHLLVGIKHLRGYEPDDNKLAIEHFDKALAADPGFALAMAYRGFADIVYHGYEATPPDILEAAVALIRRASVLDPDEPRIWWLMGIALTYSGDLDGEEQCYRKSVELNPSDANALTGLAVLTMMRGKRELGLSMYREAFRLNPYHPEWYWVDFGSALYVCEKYEEAIEAFNHRRNPRVWVLCRLAACYAQLDRMDEARAVVETIMKMRPGFRLLQERKGKWGSDNIAHFRAGMIKAGLPE